MTGTTKPQFTPCGELVRSVYPCHLLCLAIIHRAMLDTRDPLYRVEALRWLRGDGALIAEILSPDHGEKVLAWCNGMEEKWNKKLVYIRLLPPSALP